MIVRIVHSAQIAFCAAFFLAGCGGSGVSGGALADAAVSGGGGVSGSGGFGGASGGTAGVPGVVGGAGGTGGSAGAFGSGGAAGAAGAPGGGGTTSTPMCSTTMECAQADVSFPGNSSAPTPSPTQCVGGQCGLVTAYSGGYDKPKPPRSCSEICAASLYDGQPMACSASCTTKSINGFGDQTLLFDGADAGPGSVAGLVTYQFSPMSGGYKFVQVSCSQIPTSKLIQGSNSYTYVSHRCCCVAP